MPRSPLFVLEADTGLSHPPADSHNFVNLLFIIAHLIEKFSSADIFHIQ